MKYSVLLLGVVVALLAATCQSISLTLRGGQELQQQQQAECPFERQAQQTSPLPQTTVQVPTTTTCTVVGQGAAATGAQQTSAPLPQPEPLPNLPLLPPMPLSSGSPLSNNDNMTPAQLLPRAPCPYCQAQQNAQPQGSPASSSEEDSDGPSTESAEAEEEAKANAQPPPASAAAPEPQQEPPSPADQIRSQLGAKRNSIIIINRNTLSGGSSVDSTAQTAESDSESSDESGSSEESDESGPVDRKQQRQEKKMVRQQLRTLARQQKPKPPCKPYALVAASAGFRHGNVAQLFINGKQLARNRRGHNVVSFNPNKKNMSPQSRSFDTFAHKSQANQMADFLNSQDEGTWIAVACMDECSRSINRKLIKALKNYGAQRARTSFRGGYALIGQKGMRPGQGKEAVSRGTLVKVEHTVPCV